jgi:hypothetical protein
MKCILDISTSDWRKKYLLLCYLFPPATPDHGPVITGGKARYQIGDMVRLNCTSGRSKPAAHLQWFINGEPADPILTRQYETLVTGREGNEKTLYICLYIYTSICTKYIHIKYCSLYIFFLKHYLCDKKRLRDDNIGSRVSCTSATFQKRRYEIKSMNNWRIIAKYL